MLLKVISSFGHISNTVLSYLYYFQGCGGDKPEEFDGLIMFDECHKAKTVELDAQGKPNPKKSTQTAKAVGKSFYYILNNILT